MALNVALLLWNIGAEDLWLDEMMSLTMATSSWENLKALFLRFPEQHPLYYGILRVWVRLGQSEGVIRSLSALFAAMSVLTTYFLCRRVLGEWEARVTTVLMACSPFLIYYGQEARPYALLLFLALGSTLLLHHWQQSRTSGTALLYLLASVAGLYTHIVFGFVMAAHLAWSLTLGPKHRRWSMGVVATQAAATLVYSPWLWLFLSTNVNPQTWKSAQHVVLGLPYTGVRWAVGYSVVMANAGWKDRIAQLVVTELPLLLLAAFAFGVTVTAGVLRLLRSKQSSARLILFLLAVPALLALGSSPVAILVSERYLIGSFPAFLMTASVGLRVLRDNRRRLLTFGVSASFVAVTSVALWRYYDASSFGKEQWRAVTGRIAGEVQTGDVVLLHTPAIKNIFNHYFTGTAPIGVSADPAALARAADARRIWVVVAHDAVDQGREFISRLPASHARLWDTTYTKESGIRVLLLEKTVPRSH